LLTEIIPEEINSQIVSALRLLIERGQEVSGQEMPSLDISEVPFDGFQQTRGRTYWNIRIAYKIYADKDNMQQKPEDVLLLNIEDITDKVNAQAQIEALHKQQEQATFNACLFSLMESLPVGVIMVSATDQSIMMINNEAVKLMLEIGYPLKIGKDLEETRQLATGIDCEQLLNSMNIYSVTGAIVPYEKRPLPIALKHGQKTTTEFHTRRKDGQIVYLVVSAVPLRDVDGQISSAILVYQEITRLKLLERAREDFFTTMAHELKTPLANIRAHLSALQARDLQWTNEQQSAFLQTADQQVERLVGMINHFLDASRVEAGALRLEIEPILLPELLEDMEERLEALIASSNKRLVIRQPKHLPAVRGDYELLMSVLTNLLSNAFRYTPEGDAVEITVELLPPPELKQRESVKISVTDHGPGISKEMQAELFTRFSTFAALSRPSSESPGQPEITRRPRISRWSPSTGLGLYISRGIVEAHGSCLQVVSSPGQGTTFAFELPIYSAPDPSQAS
jgi:signal transduction histidine kinase